MINCTAKIQIQLRAGASHNAMNSNPADGQTMVSASVFSCSVRPKIVSTAYSAAKEPRETAPFKNPSRVKSHCRPGGRSASVADGVGKFNTSVSKMIVRLILAILQGINGR